MSNNHRPFSKAKPVIVLLLVFGSLLASTWLMITGNYGKEAAPMVFERVVGQPMPLGVSNLKVSGRSLFIKHWVWMSFDASKEALQTLTKGKEPLDSEHSQWILSRNYSANTMHERADKQAVGWKPPSSLARKEAYSVGNYDEGIMWSGYMVLDKQSNAVYVHAGD